MKKKFKVTASYVQECVVEIEAENREEAYLLAKEMDGGDFDTIIDGDDWQIDSVVEITK